MLYNKIKMFPYGTNFLEDSSVEFNFWAPDAEDVKLCLEIDGNLREFNMTRDENALYTIKTDIARHGMLYCYKINNDLKVPDPASRFQPECVHGLSQLINPDAYDWENDYNWQGKSWDETVLYEIHAGTFTPEGTFNSIKNKLDYFISLGVNAIQLMPVANFPGKRNWGYDGVLLYAPDCIYGTPDELKDLIKTAHKKGIMVFLDVIYNHFGPDGNYLHVYAKSKFFNEEIKTPWGTAINFKEKFVREFFINNAIYWINEYHFDGLRFDAVHEIYDDSSPDIMEELCSKVKAEIPINREVHLILENGNNQTKYLNNGYRAQWNDDFHHCVHVLTTGETDGYYGGYTKEKTGQPTSQLLARTLTEGFVRQDETSKGEVKSSTLPLSKFVNFIQNHDQIGNRAFGERLTLLLNENPAGENLTRASACLYTLAPSVPLIFMGEEWGSKTPFYFFCNFDDEELSNSVRKGRRGEFSKFTQFSDPQIRETIPDPTLEKTFLDSKLRWEDLENQKHAQYLEYYKYLLNIRKNKIIPIIKKISNRNYEIYSDKAFSCSWKIEDNKILRVFANFDNTETGVNSAAENIKKEDIIASSKANIQGDIQGDIQGFPDNKNLPPETVFWTLGNIYE